MPFFNKFDKPISKCIWQTKNPRIALLKLRLPERPGEEIVGISIDNKPLFKQDQVINGSHPELNPTHPT